MEWLGYPPDPGMVKKIKKSVRLWPSFPPRDTHTNEKHAKNVKGKAKGAPPKKNLPIQFRVRKNEEEEPAASQITDDPDQLDTLGCVELPFSRVQCDAATPQRFEALLPHGTAPVFPERYAKGSKCWPAEIKELLQKYSVDVDKLSLGLNFIGNREAGRNAPRLLMELAKVPLNISPAIDGRVRKFRVGVYQPHVHRI